MPPPDAPPGVVVLGGGASQQQSHHHHANHHHPGHHPRSGFSSTTTNGGVGVGVGGSSSSSFSKPSEKERVLVRYLLEQPSFGVDGDVPPDALDFAAAGVVSSRGGGRRGRDREEDERDFAVEEDEDDDVKLKAGDQHQNCCDFEEHNHHQATAESSDDGQKVMCLRLSGETVSGECLSVAGGETVSGSCTYQWQRVVPASGGIESIVGAVGPSYVTDDRDIGCHIRVIVRMMRRRRTTNESNGGAGRTSNGRRRNKSEGGYHRPVIAHATTDATVVAAVSSKHPDDERVLASDATGEGRETTRNDFGGADGGEKAALVLTTSGSTPKSASTPISEKNDYCENNNGEKGSKEVSRDDTAARSPTPSPTLLTPNGTVHNGTTVVGKNVAHSALLNNLLMKNGAETANGKNNSPSALSPNLSSNNLNNYSSGGEESFHRRRRKEILLSDRADSLIHGPGSESRLAFIRGKELEAKASGLFRKVSDAEKMKRTKELLEEEGEERDENDEDDDGEEHAKEKSNGNKSRGYSEWDSDNDRSDNAGDECDDEFSEDQFDGHNDIGDDSSAENGMDRGNSVENVSLGSLQAERVARKAKEAYEEAAMKGYPDAMQTLGRCYENGFGTRKDIFKAVEWYEKAEKLGCDEAACDLGCLYYLGRFPRDELKKRTRLVHFTDSSLSEVLSNKGDDFQIQLAKDRKKAFSLFRHAAANGSGPGANNVAMCYEEGQGGVERNWREAARWYAIAARRGVLSAHASLGYALLTLGNRLSAKEAFETGTQHGSRECAEGLRLIREAEKHAANSRKHLGNGGSNNDAMRHSKSDPENERGSAILDIVKQLEKELEKYHELSRRLYNAASLHPESLEEANAVLLSAFPDMNVSSSNASLL